MPSVSVRRPQCLSVRGPQPQACRPSFWSMCNRVHLSSQKQYNQTVVGQDKAEKRRNKCHCTWHTFVKGVSGSKVETAKDCHTEHQQQKQSRKTSAVRAAWVLWRRHTARESLTPGTKKRETSPLLKERFFPTISRLNGIYSRLIYILWV